MESHLLQRHWRAGSCLQASRLPRAPKRDRSICSDQQTLRIRGSYSAFPTVRQIKGHQGAFQPGGCNLGLILGARVLSISRAVGSF